MSDFRQMMERKGKTLENRFSIPPLPFHHYADKKSLINEWKDFIGNGENNLSVRADLTFKRSKMVSLPSIGRRLPYSQVVKITEGDAVVNIASFLNRLNYASYKHAYKRYGRQLSVVSCIEGGRKQLREKTPEKDAIKELHAHLLLERPNHISYNDFEILIQKLWIQTEWGNVQHYIQPIRNLYSSAKYNVKSSLDALDLSNTYLNTEV
jgi:hypothetical protein